MTSLRIFALYETAPLFDYIKTGDFFSGFLANLATDFIAIVGNAKPIFYGFWGEIALDRKNGYCRIKSYNELRRRNFEKR